MENEFERIKYVLDMYEGNEDKIAFLLRQIDMLIKFRNCYKEVAFKESNPGKWQFRLK